MGGKDVMGLFVFLGFLSAIFYLFFSAIRRKQQNAMQKHLLDKFSSTHDFTEFIQSPAGQKYVAGFTDSVTKPYASILNSVRIGIILIFFGLGFYLITVAPEARAHEAPYVLDGIATLLAMLGTGFLVSAAASYLIAKKLKSEPAE
jgi:hypothetical protein